jgi:CDP-glucose 4,6-dehydratase
VLECLSGYLIVGQQLLEGNISVADAWNFGPDREGNRQVKQVLAELKANWPGVEWSCSDAPQPHEAQLLYLDSGKARDRLLWRPVWTFDEGVAATAEWYRAWLDQGEVVSKQQLYRYIKLARERNLPWAGNGLK